MTFTNMGRTKAFEEMQSEIYDILIIGGGITGAGIALDGATRGMKAALFEMQDFAAGTSSRSTKLVHGGLRYLKQLEVKMVADVGKERAIVYENGPHITTPEWMLLPFYESGTFGPISTSAGLFVYDFLAGVKKQEKRKMLTKEETLHKEPLLKEEGLKGGGYYVEYRTDDARLTIETLKKAAEYGADLHNYSEVIEIVYEDGKAAGAVIRDVLTGRQYEIRARKVINAAGPWVDFIRELDGTKKGKTLTLTKGVHVVFSQAKFPLRQAVYFDNTDGRMMFAIPRGNKVYVGTSDTFYQGDPAEHSVEQEDREYILQAVNAVFPHLEMSMADIESSWSGVRPLIQEKGKGPSEISRKDEVWVSSTGLITIAGGKLTGYRKMAEKVVDLAAKQFKEEKYKLFDECMTKSIPLSGGDFGGSALMERFVEEHVSEGMDMGLSEQETRKLIRFYGTNIGKLYQLLAQHRGTMDAYGFTQEVFARLAYAIEEEKIATPVDFFFRRTGALLFDIKWVKQWSRTVTRYMADVFHWSEMEKQMRMEELETEYEAAAGEALQNEHQF